MKKRKRVIVMGAAGRDFHNFNTFFRENEDCEVVAFTAAQIPNIEGRKYPPSLSGKLYADGIPIYEESKLTELIKEKEVDEVVFGYSDVSYQYVMSRASVAAAAGADFRLMGPNSTMLESSKYVAAVCAARTGVGKSQTTRKVARIFKEMGKKVAVIRHPMPYGDLDKQICQRFADHSDLDKHDCTIEEREEYEPHLDQGFIVYAGIDYEEILRNAEKEADIILWDGGNNDIPFYKPDLHITLVDPHRPGDEMNYFPGETNLRMADVVIINKIDTAVFENVEKTRANVSKVNPEAVIIEAASPIFVEDYEVIRGKRVLVIEDGPTLTHGNMAYGAGTIAARKFGAAELIDPRPYAVGTLVDVLKENTHLFGILPAMGYGAEQMNELKETIKRADPDVVVIGTPIDLRRTIKFESPAVRVYYELQEIGEPTLEGILKEKS